MRILWRSILGLLLLLLLLILALRVPVLLLLLDIDHPSLPSAHSGAGPAQLTAISAMMVDRLHFPSKSTFGGANDGALTPLCRALPNQR